MLNLGRKFYAYVISVVLGAGLIILKFYTKDPLCDQMMNYLLIAQGIITGGIALEDGAKAIGKGIGGEVEE